MALNYLSGDDAAIGKGKKKSSGGGGGGGSKGKKATRTKKTTAEKKAGRKRVFKKVAKVAIAPARAAFLTVCRLNLLKISTKIIRVWNKPDGKEMLTKFWTGFGGNMDAFKQAVSKGGKNKISGESIGVAAEAVIATATPILIALVPIIKHFKAAGSAEEAKEFNEGVENGKKDLAEDDSVPKGKLSMPKNKDAGLVVDKNGEAQEDEKTTKENQPESKSGGSDSDEGSNDDEKKKGVKSDEDKKADAEKTMSSNFSPLGLFFMTLLYSGMYLPQNNFFIQLINSYCFLGMVLIPVATSKNYFQSIAYKISFTPINLINNFIHLTKLKWQKN